MYNQINYKCMTFYLSRSTKVRIMEAILSITIEQEHRCLLHHLFIRVTVSVHSLGYYW